MKSAASLLLLTVTLCAFAQKQSLPTSEMFALSAGSSVACYVIGCAYTEEEYEILRERIRKFATPKEREESIRYLTRKGFRISQWKRNASEWFCIFPPSYVTARSALTFGYILYEISKLAIEQEKESVQWNNLSPDFQAFMAKVIARARIIPEPHRSFVLHNLHEVRVGVDYSYYLEILSPETGQIIARPAIRKHIRFSDLNLPALFPDALARVCTQRHKMAALNVREVRWLFSWEVNPADLTELVSAYAEAAKPVIEDENAIYRSVWNYVITYCRQDILGYVGKQLLLSDLPEEMRARAEEALLMGREMGVHSIPNERWHALAVRVRDDMSLTITFPSPDIPSATDTYAFPLDENSIQRWFQSIL